MPGCNVGGFSDQLIEVSPAVMLPVVRGTIDGFELSLEKEPVLAFLGVCFGVIRAVQAAIVGLHCFRLRGLSGKNLTVPLSTQNRVCSESAINLTTER